MENDIKVPDCVNYTDCRPREERLPQIEVEAIRDYARDLKGEALSTLLAEIPDDALIAEINWRLLVRKNRLDGAREELSRGWR